MNQGVVVGMGHHTRAFSLGVKWGNSSEWHLKYMSFQTQLKLGVQWDFSKWRRWVNYRSSKSIDDKETRRDRGIYMPVDGPAALYAKPSAGKQSSVAVYIEDQHLKKGYVVGKLTAAQGLSRSFNQLAKVTKRYRMSSSHSTGWITIAIISSWWRHQIETFFALLAICAGNSPATGEFPAQRPVTQGFDVFFDLRLNKQLSKQS